MGNTESILIVDDEPALLELLSELLKVEGYRVFSAVSPELALSLARAHPVDLVLLDIVMPGMNGFELYKALKNGGHLDNVPVVFLSGRKDVESKVMGFKMGAADYIPKPFHPEELLARVKRQLEVKRYQQNLRRERKKLAEQLQQYELLNEGSYGKYEIVDLIGSGGISSVYKVRHIPLEKWMALKILNIPQDELSDESMLRFQEEARSIAKIRHSNVVEVYDSGLIQGRPYIAMEFVDGKDLETLCRQNPLPYLLAHKVLTQIASGLAAAHAQNIIHRDIKPGNLLLTANEVVKITDFGIAKDLTRKSITERGVLLGTPAYMSPQQCYGGPIDVRSDIYSLGMTLYFLLTGHPPVEESNSLAAILQNLRMPLPDPRETREDIPAYLCEILFKMTEKSPARRYQNMAEVIAQLERRVPTCGELQ